MDLRRTLGLFLLLMGCLLPVSIQAKEGHFTLEGSVKNAPDSVRIGFFYRMVRNGKVIEVNDDSVIVRHSRFTYSGTVPEGPTLLTMSSGNWETALVVEPCRMQVEWEWGKMMEARIKGAASEKEYADYKRYVALVEQLFQRNWQEISAMMEHYRSMKDDGVKDSLHQVISDCIRKNQPNMGRLTTLTSQFVKEHPDYRIAPCLISLIGRQLPADSLQLLYEALPEVSRRSPAGELCSLEIQTFAQKESYEQRPLVGNRAWDFELSTSCGNKVHLQSFRGQYILLDFWASWCMPCIKGLPALSAFYKRYKSKGLMLISISLDDREADWCRAIAQYKMDWTQVRDSLSGKNNKMKVSDLYQVQYLPTFVLIDRTGKVVARSNALDDAFYEALEKAEIPDRGRAD